MTSRGKRQVFTELIDEVRRSQAATARFDEAVGAAVGLNQTDMRCVDALGREQPATAGRLAEITGLSTGAMTTALDRLERSGFARRVRDPGDRRRVLVELTDRASELGAFYAQHEALGERMYRRHSEAELELLLGFVREGREFNELRAAELEEAEERRARRA